MSLNPSALFSLSYGLYALTTFDGKKDNACIVNTVIQHTSDPTLVSVTVNKTNYTHDIMLETGKVNVNCLSVEAPFSVFESFGFSSGREVDKMNSVSFTRTENGLALLSDYVNAYLSLSVKNYTDLGSHGLFVCEVTESDVISDLESMTYAYYHKNVKPKAKPAEKKGFVCKICGYVHQSDTLPDDFICPWCKHPASDFEPIR